MMRYVFSGFFLFLSLFMAGQTSGPATPKHIQVDRNINLDVLFTVYNQIWTPFLDEGVSESMLENTRLMKVNHDYFVEFKNHVAISKSRDFMQKSGTDFFLYAFYYDNFPNATRIRDIPEILTKDINPDRSLALAEIDALMSDIASFVRESDFKRFQNQYAYVHRMAKEEVLKNLPKTGFISFMEDYFGSEYTAYNFYVIPFFKTEFGMAHQIPTEEGMENITFIAPFEPAELVLVNRVRYVGYESQKDILEWVVHEYSHTFFNPPLITDQHMNMLNEFDHLYQTIESSPYYSNWFSIFAEHLAVAFEVRAAVLLGEEGRAKDIRERHNDWPYLDHFINQLKYYEEHRAKYPNIASFIPAVIASCKMLE